MLPQHVAATGHRLLDVAGAPPRRPAITTSIDIQYSTYHLPWKPTEPSNSITRVADACALLAVVGTGESGADLVEGDAREVGGKGATAAGNEGAAPPTPVAPGGAEEAGTTEEGQCEDGAKVGELQYVMRTGLPTVGREQCDEPRPYVSGLEVEVISKHKIGRRLLFAAVAPSTFGTLEGRVGRRSHPLQIHKRWM